MRDLMALNSKIERTTANGLAAFVVGIMTIAVCMILVVPIMIWPSYDYLFSLVWINLSLLVAVHISIDFVELILGLIWSPVRIPVAQENVVNRDRTAVLMTVCDDIDFEAIASLLPLAEAGYRVYILDDSVNDITLDCEIGDSIVYRRRRERTGAKAGNLNNWLRQCGADYDNIVLLDSDSVITVKAIDTLVQAASHPANTRFAIFQSKIGPRTNIGTTLLSRVLALGSRGRVRIRERVHARFDLLVSLGHNQLIRAADLQRIGGFNEDFTAEDTALSLAFSAIGLRTALVDVWTKDLEPATLDAWVRRTVRWGRQTIELFRGDWLDSSFMLKLLLCRHLLSYISPAIFCLLLILSLLTGPISVEQVLTFSGRSLRFESGYTTSGFLLLSTAMLFLISTVLRVALTVIEERVSKRLLLVALASGPALQAILILPVTAGLIASAIGSSAKFVPTHGKLAARRTYVYCGLTWTAGACLLALAAARPGSALLGLNWVTILAFTTSPAVFFLLRRSERSDSTAANNQADLNDVS